MVTLRLLFLVVAAGLVLPVQPVPPVQRGLLLRAQPVPPPRFPALPVRKVALEWLAPRVLPAMLPRFLALREVQALPELRLLAPPVLPVQPVQREAADLRLL